MENSGSRLLPHRQAINRQISSQVGDHWRTPAVAFTANNLHNCINICSTQAACRAASYAATSKSCCLKSTVNAAFANSKVSGLVRLQYVPAPIACPADGLNRIKGASGKGFTVQCGTDHPRGDIKSVATLDFANCISLNSQQIKEPSGRSFTIACNADRPGVLVERDLVNCFYADKLPSRRAEQQDSADINTDDINVHKEDDINIYTKDDIDSNTKDLISLWSHDLTSLRRHGHNVYVHK
ncbi:hypothetical protein TRIATDRAFT_90791 [Trichoderma atroviride IMI 206040]|uniref:Apple domain-containing protein n=1 Tax=Hypocrea atroviridis (strain ATCC 20476 / IMI 206040) TaxID=452589 RepID=G9NQ37_HYPAI|nr:uncharacterized protein TRIATDRAFT_90791 [Trichoderma atroviride IMI 206040]EHK47189.1 hypothetical protein TRIATDRAFT_90791 [Trichoderma atroviride IMI 206040]